MKHVKRAITLAIVVSILALSFPASAAVELRGYDKNGVSGQRYQYITFGRYPSTKEAASLDIASAPKEPVLWRVLGKNEDGSLIIITEHIIDFVRYHDTKIEPTRIDPQTRKEVVTRELHYVETLIYKYCTEVCVPTMFTESEQRALMDLPYVDSEPMPTQGNPPASRGKLAPPSCEELMRVEYGFTNSTILTPMRQSWGTEFAIGKGLMTFVETKRCSWYWTSTRRRPGYRFIVGDNGHISASGIDRAGGGLRPICIIKPELLECTGGTGTKDDPFALEIAQSE